MSCKFTQFHKKWQKCNCRKTYFKKHILIKLGTKYKLKLNFISTELAKVQDQEVGDGTTSVTVLAAELLRVNYLFK